MGRQGGAGGEEGGPEQQLSTSRAEQQLAGPGSTVDLQRSLQINDNCRDAPLSRAPPLGVIVPDDSNGRNGPATPGAPPPVSRDGPAGL